MNQMQTTNNKFANFRQFCKRVWALSAPYFKSEDKWKARGLLAAIVLLNLAAVYMLVLLNEWNRVFYDALQNKDAAVFWTQLGRFTYLAFCLHHHRGLPFLSDATSRGTLARLDDGQLPATLAG